MDGPIRRLLPVLAARALWAILWPAIGLAVIVVLTAAWGPNRSDIGVLEFLALLGRLGLAAGMLFGAVVAILEPRRATGIAAVIRLAAYGVIAALLTGILAGLQPSAITNACVLGAVSGPASILAARTYAVRCSSRVQPQ